MRDEGMYQCKAYNELDTRYSSGQLRVLSFPPSFAKFPLEEKVYAAERGNITLRCRPEGAPTPKFNWRKDGNLIYSDGKYEIQKNGNLFISRLTVADSARYTCEAENGNFKQNQCCQLRNTFFSNSDYFCRIWQG